MGLLQSILSCERQGKGFFYIIISRQGLELLMGADTRTWWACWVDCESAPETSWATGADADGRRGLRCVSPRFRGAGRPTSCPAARPSVHARRSPSSPSHRATASPQPTGMVEYIQFALGYATLLLLICLRVARILGFCQGRLELPTRQHLLCLCLRT